MNVKLKQLRLKNYCQYADYTFDFTKPDGTPYHYIGLFGRNGVGKTNVLNAITMLVTPESVGRDVKLIKQSLRKFVRNEDYNQITTSYSELPRSMLISGVFEYDGKDYTIEMTEDGCTRNDFAPITQDTELEDRFAAKQSGPWGKDYLRYLSRMSFYLKSETEISSSKFQINKHSAKQFEEIVSLITGYPAKCDGSLYNDTMFYTDFYLTKNHDFKIHFKSMSKGERKIAKSFSELFNLCHSLANPKAGETSMAGWPSFVLMDEIENSVYYKSHVKFLQAIRQAYAEQQIFATTHSGVIIERFLNSEHDKEGEIMFDIGVI